MLFIVSAFMPATSFQNFGVGWQKPALVVLKMGAIAHDSGWVRAGANGKNLGEQ
jgi:hypothetical protein